MMFGLEEDMEDAKFHYHISHQIEIWHILFDISLRDALRELWIT